MVRNPYTASGKDLVSVLPWDTEQQFNTWRSAIGECGLELTRGVPFWEAFYRRLRVEDAPEYAREVIYDSGLGYMAKGCKHAVVDDDARYSFYLAFGMMPDVQVALEELPHDIVYEQPRPVTIGEIVPLNSLLHYDKTKRL